MELFPDRAHVRLLSRVHGTYLHADEDGWSVSLSPHRASLNTAWAVHRLEHVGVSYVLLHSAAYGRYLAVLPHPSLEDQHFGVFQRVYDTPIQVDIMWRVFPASDGNGGVELRHPVHPHVGLPPWIVEAIPPRPLPPNLPEEIPNGVEHPVVLRRIIRYVRANNFGIFNLPWRTFRLNGRSVVDLVGALGVILGANFNNITLCVRAGFHGRLTPLVIDLPISEEPMDIVVFVTDAPEHLELQHPDVDAP
ncbi:hypothetical protein SEVIR_4G062300v4 [Setaria viridis]|uniref:Uncharacterized protein n=1 Tax=Setaria viridis TaxID=4556 RepID=A0A4U6UUE4_SETVI|nr:uncharacterized protein LOC117853826 [Setaria viridis]TKW20088.1 hypothetical protein SEVIR_4G062300v2 [Setaria viridis]